MKIIGYNSSHDTSLCQFDTDTWEIDWLYEEERFRRVKLWHPEPPNTKLLCIEHKRIEKPDAFIGCSYDRREYNWGFNNDVIEYDKLLQRSILATLAEQQLSYDRIQEVKEQYKHSSVDLFQDKYLETVLDDNLYADVANQLEMEEFHCEIEHHMYHAECGYWFSPWREKEEAIAITMDGGGCMKYMEEWPNYQECETIYLCQPDRKPFRQWGRLSNFRWLDNLHGDYFNEEQIMSHAAPDETVVIDGCPTVISSRPSMGMNFSSLSLFFGFDIRGRSAGKVMGAASYQPWLDHEEGYVDFTTYSVGNLLQQKSFEYTCGLIEKAIEFNPDIPNIILSGGYALNCTNNAKYLERFPNHQIFIDPVAHDGGTAVGGAIRLARALQQGEEL